MRHKIDDINAKIISSILKRIDHYKKENNISIIDKQSKEQVISFFEKKFIRRGIKDITGRTLARSLTDFTIEEKRDLINVK